MRLIMRAAIGMALAAGGLTFFVYGLQQAIENGSCGTPDTATGAYYGPCPEGTGPMIVAMVFGLLAALVGAGIAGVLARFVPAVVIGAVAAAVFGVVDINENDTRPGYEALAAALAPVILFCVPGLGRRRSLPRVVPAQMAEMAQQMAAMAKAAHTAHTAQAGQTPPTEPVASFGTASQWQPRTTPTTPAQAEEIASRLRQLEQLKESGLLGDAEYAERRKQILGEL